MERITLHVSYRLANRKLLNCNYEIQKYSFSVPESVGTCMNILLSLRGPHSCVLFTTIQYTYLTYLLHIIFVMFGRGSCRAIVSRVNVLMILPSNGFLCMLVPVYHRVVCPVRFFLLIRTRALLSLTKKQVSEYTDQRNTEYCILSLSLFVFKDGCQGNNL